MSRLTELAAELEVLRTEITELDAVETPDEDQAARMEAIIPEWDTKKAEHDVLAERAEKVEAVRSASLSAANRETGAPTFIAKRNEGEIMYFFSEIDRRLSEVESYYVTSFARISA